MRTVARDTSPDAARAQAEAYRRLSPGERLAAYLAACDDMRRLLIDGIRHRHPDFSDEQVRQAVLRAVLGPGLAEKVIAAGR